MKSRIPIEVVVAVLAAISCLVAFIPGFAIPVWALFIGWAWYFALGATPSVMKTIYFSILPGAILAATCIWLNDLFGVSMSSLWAVMLSVLITVFFLMLFLKIPGTNGLVGFNAYSTIFAVFYGGFSPHSGELKTDIIIALIYGVVGLCLGPLFGYFSVYFTFPQKDKDKNDKK